jgi:hypothetical protein
MTASIYLCLARLTVVYGAHLSVLSPQKYTILFISCDIVSLVLQAVGGALTATANTNADSDVGVDIMIAGLAFQVFSLLIFMAFCAHFAWRVSKTEPDALGMRFESLRNRKVFRLFIWGRISLHDRPWHVLIYLYSSSNRYNHHFCTLRFPRGRIESRIQGSNRR